jgi:DNA replication protein DnaC
MNKEKTYGRNEKDLRKNLRYLKLITIEKIYEEEAKSAASNNLSHIEYFERLINEEVNDKMSRAIKKRIIKAKFPKIKTIDEYDFNYPKKINKQQILKLFDLKFTEEPKNIIILGPTGVGKSHLASAIGYASCLGNIWTRYTTAIDIVNDLYASLSDSTFSVKLAKYTKPRVLVIDELGYLPIDKKGADSIFQVISKRYESGSIIITSNLAFKEWGKIFADNTIASAIVDRLVHHAEIIKIEGESYRLKDKGKKSLMED